MAGFFPPDDASAVASPPNPAPVGTPGYFSSASLTVPATIVSQDFLNGIVIEMKNLADVATGALPLPTSGPLALSKSTPTLVPNIQGLVALQLGGYVKKIGDVMTGNLTLGTNYGGNNDTPALVVQSGQSNLKVTLNAAADRSYNPLTKAGDTVLTYTDGSLGSGALVIAPWSTSGGGIRLDSAGALTVSASAVFTASVAMQNTATGLTSAVNTNSTALATTAFVLNQAGNLAPAMNSIGTAGTSSQFARQDHVHPSDTSRVRQGGGVGQLPNTLNLGWSSSGLRLTVDAVTDIGGVGMLKGQWGDNVTTQTWTSPNAFSQPISANAGLVVNGVGPFDSGQIRLNAGTSGFSIYNNGVATFFFLESGPGQTYNGLRPLAIDNASGALSIAGNGQDTAFGGRLMVSSEIWGAGQIVANNGFVRAAKGVRQWFDPTVCTILADFSLVGTGGGNGYLVLPNGMMVQFGNGVTTSGQQDWVNLPTSFPAYFASIVVSERNSAGWWSGGTIINGTLYGTTKVGNAAFQVSCVRLSNAGGFHMNTGNACAYDWIAIGW